MLAFSVFGPVFLCVHDHVVDVPQGSIDLVLKLVMVHEVFDDSVVQAQLCRQHLDIIEMFLHEVTHGLPELRYADQQISPQLVNVVMDRSHNFQDL